MGDGLNTLETLDHVHMHAHKNKILTINIKTFNETPYYIPEELKSSQVIFDLTKKIMYNFH